jgi:hypothetical protein
MNGSKAGWIVAVLLALIAGGQAATYSRLGSVEARVRSGASQEDVNALEIEKLRTRVAALERKLARESKPAKK